MNNNNVYNTYSICTKCTVFILLLKQTYRKCAIGICVYILYSSSTICTVNSILAKDKKNRDLIHPLPIHNFAMRIKNEKNIKICQVDFKVGI